MSPWRLLLTRPAEESARLAEALTAQGIHSVSLPLLVIEPTAETPEQRGRVLELDRYAIVIAVSRPAARLGLERIDRYWPQLPIAQRWFAVGNGTAQVLAGYGIEAPSPVAGGGSEALVALPDFRDALGGLPARVLILRGQGGREWLAEQLQAAGHEVDYLELYRRGLPDYAPGTLAGRLEAERLNGVVVSSGQGLQHLWQLAGNDPDKIRRLPLFVPSARVAELAREAGASRVVECRGIGPEALVDALAATAPID